MFRLISTLINLYCIIYQCEWSLNPPFFTTNPFDNRIFPRPRILTAESGLGRKGRLSDDGNAEIVYTQIGPVQGFKMKISNSKEVFAYTGVPYGESTAGENRFRPPVAKKPWQGVWDATFPSPMCLQYLPFAAGVDQVRGKEDCLTVDIYTPQLPRNGSEHRLPVFLFIPGGSFWFGDSRTYGPKYLLREDVIFVAINVRMEVFGWLSTGDEHAPGNWALKDQALSIEFVHNNIKRRNYVSGIMCFSGTSLYASLDVHGSVRRISDSAAESVGCPTSGGVGATSSVYDSTSSVHTHFGTSGPFCFHYGATEVQYMKRAVPPIPLIVSRAEDELQMELLPMRPSLPFLPLYFQLMPVAFHLGFRNTFDIVDASVSQASFRKVHQFYFGKSTPPNFLVGPDYSTFIQMMNDAFVNAPMWKSIEYHHKIAPTYAYIQKNNVIGEMPLLAFARGITRRYGAGHGSELGLLFNMSRMTYPLKPGSDFDIASRRLVNLIVNFADHGAPLYRNEEGKLLDVWKPVTDMNNPIALEVGLVKDIKMIVDPVKASGRLRIWEEKEIADVEAQRYFRNFSPLSFTSHVEYLRLNHQLEMGPTFLVQFLCAWFQCEFGPMPPFIYTNPDNRRLLPPNPLSAPFRSGESFSNEPVVHTNLGPIRGFRMKISESREIFSFTGVPYGESTAGANRFRDPVPRRPWKGTWDATYPSPFCVQSSATLGNMIRGQEECLFLDIYTPKIPQNGDKNHPLLPVIMWIPAGSSTFGRSRFYGPKYFLREDVILVPINHRVGLFGYLSTGDEHCSGNWALKDQALSVEWVHNNIKAFGGDPNRIIIGGISSGGSTSHLMLFTNHRARNFIKGIIAMSGTALVNQALDAVGQVREMSDLVADSANCPNSTARDGSWRM
ncbi:Esterase E4, partial [Orchesella cincta]